MLYNVFIFLFMKLILLFSIIILFFFRIKIRDGSVVIDLFLGYELLLVFCISFNIKWVFLEYNLIDKCFNLCFFFFICCWKSLDFFFLRLRLILNLLWWICLIIVWYFFCCLEVNVSCVRELLLVFNIVFGR